MAGAGASLDRNSLGFLFQLSLPNSDQSLPALQYLTWVYAQESEMVKLLGNRKREHGWQFMSCYAILRGSDPIDPARHIGPEKPFWLAEWEFCVSI